MFWDKGVLGFGRLRVSVFKGQGFQGSGVLRVRVFGG